MTIIRRRSETQTEQGGRNAGTAAPPSRACCACCRLVLSALALSWSGAIEGDSNFSHAPPSPLLAIACCSHRCTLLWTLPALVSSVQQDALDSTSLPPHEEELGGWARMISLNATYPNQLLVKDVVDFGRKSSCVVQIKHPAVR